MNRKAYGFTLIELLIVIVVIGVLAALAIVIYSGMRVRAERAAVQTEIKQIEKTLNVFVASTSTRPQGQWACIGYASDYPAEGNFPAGSCAIRSVDGGATWTSYYNVDTDGALLSDQLAVHASKTSATHDVITLTYRYNTQYVYKWRGIVYDDRRTSDDYATLTYAIPGTTCLDSDYVSSYDGGAMCTYKLFPISVGPWVN